MAGNAKLALTAEGMATVRAQSNQEYYHYIETFRGKMLFAVAKRIMPRVITERLELSSAILDTIDTYKPEQILELAGGASMYGVGWSAKNPDKVYVEVDLPHVVQWKREKISEIKSKEGLPQAPNYHIETLDLIQADLLDKVGSCFDLSKRTLIIAEGLDMYFNPDQHKSFMGNVSRFLKAFDEASFVSHDFNVDAFNGASARGIQKIFIAYVSKRINNKFYRHFDSFGGIEAYFSSIGFSSCRTIQDVLGSEVAAQRYPNMTQEETLFPYYMVSQ